MSAGGTAAFNQWPVMQSEWPQREIYTQSCKQSLWGVLMPHNKNNLYTLPKCLSNLNILISPLFRLNKSISEITTFLFRLLKTHRTNIFSFDWFLWSLTLLKSIYTKVMLPYMSQYVLLKKKKRKKKGENHSVSNNEHVHLFASGLHTQFSQKARADHDLAFDISCLQASRD